MIRPLKKTFDSQFKNHKEFNLVRIPNYEEFCNAYTNNIDYYQSVFEILADLDAKVKYSDDPEESVIISYKPDGEVIFDLVAFKEEEGARVVVYEFSTFIS